MNKEQVPTAQEEEQKIIRDSIFASRREIEQARWDRLDRDD